MAISIDFFGIFGLHGKLDIKIPIKDNRLILIGVNGLGKTTVVNILYFALTDQWARLLDYDFSSIELSINSQHLVINKSDIQQKVRSAELQQRQLVRFSNRSAFPISVARRVVTHPLYRDLVVSDFSSDRISNFARLISKDIGVGQSTVLNVIKDFYHDANRDLFSENSESNPISNLSILLKNSGPHKVIYLPTYRRIEQDLKSIFPSADEVELRKLTAAAESSLSARSKGHVELVQFGMQDVESKINEELEYIQRRTSSQLSSLTGSYLQDIIRNRAGKIPHDLLKTIPEEAVRAVLERVDENTLSVNDKWEIEAAISRVKKDQNTDVRDGYLAYFFGRLLEIYKDLYNSEESIRQLTETCNRYLERKTLHYDDREFTIQIHDNDKSPLEWRMLSSGEKQVASLFTHLFLSREQSHVVIIDEPELSLSVPWQKALLPDISRADSCNLLIAVTHSPFIYANELDRYAVDLGRLIQSGYH